MTDRINEAAHAAVSAATTASTVLLDEVHGRDPKLRHDVERAIAAGATLELAVRFAETMCEIRLAVRGPTGKSTEICTMRTAITQTVN